MAFFLFREAQSAVGRVGQVRLLCDVLWPDRSHLAGATHGIR